MLVYNGGMDRPFKDVLGELIPELCTERREVIYLDADLMSCINTAKWAAEHPTRAINCGIAEANMIGVACGLAAVGFKPIVHSFGPFASRRCFDQLFLSAGYAGNDITVIGTDPGVTAAYNGGTHMPFEDMALLRTIPTATVIDVTDTAMLKSVLKECVDRPGVKYIRVPRKPSAKVFAENAHIPIGPAVTLREGTDVAILAIGIMVHEAMQAAQELEEEGISAAVVNPFTVKPLDEKTVVDLARACRAVVTAENHNRIGGLYAAVAELLARKCPRPMEYVAVEDLYGEVGAQPYLQERFDLTSAHIVRAARTALRRANDLDANTWRG